VSAPHWTTSACQCHVSAPHWSTSPMWVPHMPRVSTSLVHLTQPMPRGIILFNPVRFPRDTWQALIGPNHRPHQHSCHLAAYEWSTAARKVSNGSTQRSHLNSICHVAPSHWSMSASGPHPSTSHLTGGPHHSATWQTASGPHQLALATWHNHRKPHHSAYATWHHTTVPPYPAYCWVLECPNLINAQAAERP
jgi:hypothetical protein